MTGDLISLGKFAKAAERGTREFRELLRDFLSPAAVEAGQYLADQVRIFRFIAAIRAMLKAKEMIAKSGLDSHSIDLKRLIPLLEGASLEEDDDLVSRWAGLIASAATTSDTLPAFADILRQLTPEEARMLDFIFYNAADVPGLAGPAPGVDKADLQEASALSQEQFLVRVQNLHRLELIVQLTIGALEPVRGFRGWGHSGHVGLTALGEAFMRACRGPETVVADVL
jgi:hypothetical protein